VFFWLLRGRSVAVYGAALALVLGLNVYSLTTGDPSLVTPRSVLGSTPENRAELITYLTSVGLTRIYTDYWLAYPLAFESDERIIPAVMSGGLDRYAAYAEQVRHAERPAFVLIRGTAEADAFWRRLEPVGATAKVEQVSIYDVVYDVDPLTTLVPHRAR
jgi:hypothetical protein